MDAGRWSGAFHLSGYAIELALKAIIARQFGADEIPDRKLVQKIWTHDLEALLELAQLGPALQQTCAGSPETEANWNTIKKWNESARYRKIDEAEARAMLDAIIDPRGGLFEWIRSRP